MTYKWGDFKQSFIGGFISVIFFFALRDTPIAIDPIIGLAITGVLAYAYYNGFHMQHKEKHYVMNWIVAFVISAGLAIIFNLATAADIFTWSVFGSTIIVGAWIAFPAGMIYDRFNIMNPMRRSYVSKK